MRRVVTLALLLVAGAAVAAEEERPLNPLAALPAEALRDFRERPLFSPSRELPEEIVDEPVPEPEAPPPTAVLIGVMVAGGRSVAIVLDPDAGGSTSVGVGDDIEGWEVTAIEPDHLVVTLDGRSETLRMFVPGRGPTGGGETGGEDDEEAPARPRTGPPAADMESLATATADELFERIRRRAQRR